MKIRESAAQATRSGVTLLLLSFLAMTTHAGEIDLSSWSGLTLDFPDGQAASAWVLEPGNLGIVQTENADPSFYLNNIDDTGYTMSGSWQFIGDGDDDYMGFVFGYQNSSNFYLFDWKRRAQDHYGANAEEGMTIKKYHRRDRRWSCRSVLGGVFRECRESGLHGNSGPTSRIRQGLDRRSRSTISNWTSI